MTRELAFYPLVLSQFWEASLGVSYGWWAYQHDQMIGIFLKPHCDLPVEAVLVWTLGSWTTVIVYETILTALHAGQKGWSLFGVIRASESELELVKHKHRKAGRGNSMEGPDICPRYYFREISCFFAKILPIPVVCVRRCEQIQSLGIPHSLVVGAWSLVITRPSSS